MAEQHQVRSWGGSEKNGKREEYDLIINGRKVPLNWTCKVSPAAFSFRTEEDCDGQWRGGDLNEEENGQISSSEDSFGTFYCLTLNYCATKASKWSVKSVKVGIGRHLKRNLQSQTTQLQCRTNTFLFVQIKVEFVSDKMRDCSVKHTRVMAWQGLVWPLAYRG